MLTVQSSIILYFSGTKTVMAENTFFPANFTDVALPEAKLTAAGFNMTSDNSVTVSQLL